MAYPHLFATGASHHTDPNISFADYLNATRNMIANHRIDLHDDAEKIIDANAPFEWRPDNNPNTNHYENGVLLIHGLYDSPFSLRDLGQQFLDKGFLVRSVLLPGHGTVAGDLLHVHRNNWLHTVQYAIQKTAPMVKNFYLCGFSLGAGLAILSANVAGNTRGLITLSPAVKPKHPFANLARYHKIFSWVSHTAKWYQLQEQKSFIKYNAHAHNPAHHATTIMKAARNTQIDIPLFVACSEDDETIVFDEMLAFYQRQTNEFNRMITYTNHTHSTYCREKNIECRTSSYPDQRIINFSHPCLPISPENWYLGKKGEYIDFDHYENGQEKLSDDLKIGAINKQTLAKFKMQRLTYNPDFTSMWHAIYNFIQNI